VAKRTIKPGPYIVPMPTVLVGSLVEGRPNFMTAAFCGIANYQPAVIGCGLSPTHRTCRGIEEHGAFSVNVPSRDQVVITDYCGLVSGDKVDKSTLFETFTGSLPGAPMIASFPLTAECRLLQSVPFGGDTLYLAEIVAVHAEEGILTNDQLDWHKLQPLLFTFPDAGYWAKGEYVAKAWSVGKQHPR
jgi:flavin reductase (DIM6/NTAB) family NADH-FMN oxidoreductase RutF